MLLIFHGICIVLFVILSIVFLRGKGAFLIAGYNTASQSEKNKINEKALCRFMGKLMLVLACCWLLIAASEVFHQMFLLWIGLGLFFIIIIGAVIYANTGNRFKRSN